MSEYVQILETYVVIYSGANQTTQQLNQGQPLGPSSLICIPEVNVNSLYLKLIGNIRVYQGCRGSLRLADERIPALPYDIVMVRLEKRPFREQSGSLRTPSKCSIGHYRVHLVCVCIVLVVLMFSFYTYHS